MTAPLNDVGRGLSAKALGIATAIGILVAISISLIVWKHRSETGASTAIAGSQIFIRGDDHLFCIGSATSKNQ